MTVFFGLGEGGRWVWENKNTSKIVGDADDTVGASTHRVDDDENIVFIFWGWVWGVWQVQHF